MTKRWHATVILVGLLAGDVGGQALAWALLPAGLALAVVLALSCGLIVGIRLLTASYPRHGWL